MANSINKEDNKIKTVILIASISFILVSLMIAPTGNKIDATPNVFKATLTGKEEVPPVSTDGIGTALFQVDAKSMQSQVNVLNTGKVMEVNIHSGEEGENGDMIVNLYKSKKIKRTNENLTNITGVSSTIQKSSSFSASRTIHDSDLVGPMEGKSIQDLITKMQNGDTYVNVHTRDFPDGEIRGQIFTDSN